MCHALTTRNKPCRARGYTNTVKVEEAFTDPPAVYYTSFCTRHVRALNDGPLMIWRFNDQYTMTPTPVRLSLKPVTE